MRPHLSSSVGGCSCHRKPARSSVRPACGLQPALCVSQGSRDRSSRKE